LADYWAVETEVDICDGQGAIRTGLVALGDVHAAGEGGVVVDEEDFSVVAEVEMDLGRQDSGREKAYCGHSVAFEEGDNGWPAIKLAKTIYNHPHIHPALVGFNEGFCKAVARGVRGKDIGADKDLVFGVMDGVQHGRVGRITVMEDMDAVAASQRGI